MTRRFVLSERRDERRRAHSAIDDAPAGYVVELREPTRSLEQNSRLHALISDIAKTRKWAGEYRDTNTWKRLLIGAWMRATNRQVLLLPALDGVGVDVIYEHSAQMTVASLTELMDFVEAWRDTSDD